LGSNLVKPASLVIDSRGIYYDTSRDNDLKYYFDHFKITPKQIREAKKLQELIINNNISKYNCQPIIKPQWLAKNEKIILIPGQVEDDESIKYGATDIKTNLQLLERVRDLNPNSYIVYKPHPDVLAGNRKGFIEKNKVLKIANYFEEKVSIISCINSCDEVHTITSLAGFEALIRKTKVFCYGRSFYSILLSKKNFIKFSDNYLTHKLNYCFLIKYCKCVLKKKYSEILKKNFKKIQFSKIKINFIQKITNHFS